MTGNTWQLPRELVINDIDEIKLYVTAEFLEPPKVAIDCEALERVDAIGIQFLLAFILKRQKKNNQTTWINLSEVLLSSIEQLGVDKLSLTID